MAITTLDGLVAAMAQRGQQRPINKASIANTGAGAAFSFWRSAGLPAAGAIPTTAAVCTIGLAGALAYTDPTSGLAGYLAHLSLMSGIAGTAIEMHDRLAHMGGLNATLTTAQTVGVDVTGSGDNMPARIGNGGYSDVLWWFENYADLGVTPVNATVTYTNGAGVSGQTCVVAFGGATPLYRASRMTPILTTNGEAIQSIQSVTLSATTAAAGNFGVTATRRIAIMPTGGAFTMTALDWAGLALPKVEDDPCLMFMAWATTTSTGIVAGLARFISG